MKESPYTISHLVVIFRPLSNSLERIKINLI